MFVYSGKLKWLSNGVDETFVIVLPNGPVRVGDAAYFFTQWTVDDTGVKKTNWFQHLIVDKVTKTATGDDTFSFKSHYYSFEVTSKDVYGKLDLTMSKPGAEGLMTLDRIWQSEGAESTQVGRIWTGKIDWLSFAKDEMAIFIAPDGLGEGKTILSLWQWTQDSAGTKKSPSFGEAVQKVEPGAPEGQIKFSYHSYYDIDCTWDETTEKLAVKMTEKGTTQDIGVMTIAAIIDRHAHDFNPPEASPSKVELEVRLPQPQDNLPRILTPMPFPKGIFDTLVHAAAFVDQAGYLAKHAQERFIALDADIHARDNQLKAAKAENGLAAETVKRLDGELSVEKAKNEDASKQLANARDDAEKEKKELLKRIDDQRDQLKKGLADDVKDHKILAATRKELDGERGKLAELKKTLDAVNSNVTSLTAQLATAQKTSGDLLKVHLKLENELDVEKTYSKRHKAAKEKAEAANIDLGKKVLALQKALDAARKDDVDQECLIKDLRAKLGTVKEEKHKALKERDTANGQLAAIKKTFFPNGA